MQERKTQTNKQRLSPSSSTQQTLSIRTSPSANPSTRRIKHYSRQGCRACKARRVKCTEEQPACSHCLRRGDHCVYPSVPFRFDGRKDSPASQVSRTTPPTRQCPTPLSSPSPESSSSRSLSTAPSTPMPALERRLIDHFFGYVRPSIPTGGSDVWKKELPARIEHSRVIKSAVLALASTHLALQDPTISPLLGYRYRQATLEGIRDILPSRTGKTIESVAVQDLEAANIATVGILWQSGMLGDAFFDFIPLIRGSRYLIQACLAQEHPTDYVQLLFRSQQEKTTFPPKEFFERTDADINPLILDAADTSLMNLQPLCADNPTYTVFLEALLNTIQLARSSTITRYFAGKTANANPQNKIVMDMADEDLNRIIYSSDPIPTILQAHFIAIQVIDSTRILFLSTEEINTSDWRPVSPVSTYLRSICQKLEHGPYHEYIQWPLRIGRNVTERHRQHGWVSAAAQWRALKEEPERFA